MLLILVSTFSQKLHHHYTTIREVGIHQLVEPLYPVDHPLIDSAIKACSEAEMRTLSGLFLEALLFPDLGVILQYTFALSPG